MVASVLAALLGLLLALSCASFGRSALEVESRARIAQEGILAAQSIACDFGGFLADPPGRAGDLNQYSFTSWDISQSNVLILYFRGATMSDVVVVTYEQNGDQLLRSNQSTGMTTTIARHVTAFSVGPNPENAAQAQIIMTITFRYFSATYTLYGISPT
jgi:hypothetical protein